MPPEQTTSQPDQQNQPAATKPLMDILAAAGMADEGATATNSNVNTPMAGAEGAGAAASVAAPASATSTETAAAGEKPADEAGGTTPPVQPPADPRLKLLTDLGLQDVTDFDSGFNRLAEAYRQVTTETAQQRAEREAAQRQAEIDRAIEARLGKQQAPDDKPAEPQLPFGLGTWKKPDPELLSQYVVEKKGEDGQVTRELADNTPVELRNQVETFSRQRREFATAFNDDPLGVLKQIIPHIVTPLVNDTIQQRAQVSEEEAFFNSIPQQHPYLFEVHPVTNKPDSTRLSKHGEQFAAAMEQAKEWGITDPRKQFEAAIRMVPPPAPPKSPAAQAAEIESQRRDAQAKHLQQTAAANTPIQSDRGGSFPPPGGGGVQNRNQGAGDLLYEALGQLPRK